MQSRDEKRSRNEALWAHYDPKDYVGGFFGFTCNLQQVASMSFEPAIRVQVGPPACYKGCLAILPDGDLIATPMSPDRTGDVLSSLVYRSGDGGLTWDEIAAPRDLPGKEHCLAALSNGDLLHVGYKGELSRSEDGGRTWRARYGVLPFKAFTRNVEERDDGALILVGVGAQRSAERLILCTSDDRGLTWQGKEAPVETGYPVFTEYKGDRVNTEEPCWLTLPDGRMLLAFRGEQSRIIDGYTPPFLHGTYSEAGDHMLVAESSDGGAHWSMPRSFTNYGEPHGYFTLLDDGRLLCTYANYHLPYGVFAILSRDLGRTWDLDHPVMLALSGDCFCGWPTTLQLPDGDLITSYAIAAYPAREASQKGAFQVVRWRAPS